MKENPEIIDKLLGLYYFSKITGTKESKDGYIYFLTPVNDFDEDLGGPRYNDMKESVVRAKNGVLYIFPSWFFNSESGEKSKFLNYIPGLTLKNILDYIFKGFKKRYPELKLEKRDDWFNYAFEDEIK